MHEQVWEGASRIPEWDLLYLLGSGQPTLWPAQCIRDDVTRMLEKKTKIGVYQQAKLTLRFVSGVVYLLEM